MSHKRPDPDSPSDVHIMKKHKVSKRKSRIPVHFVPTFLSLDIPGSSSSVVCDYDNIFYMRVSACYRYLRPQLMRRSVRAQARAPLAPNILVPALSEETGTFVYDGLKLLMKIRNAEEATSEAESVAMVSLVATQLWSILKGKKEETENRDVEESDSTSTSTLSLVMDVEAEGSDDKE